MFNSKQCALILVGLSLTVASAQHEGLHARSLESEPFFCREALDCGECVLNGCSWAAGQCLNSCTEIADASCYSAFDTGMTAQRVCELVREEENNQALCGAQTDCGSCTSTKLTGGTGDTCYWHPEWQTCKPLVCDAHSCGSDFCLSPEEEKCFFAGNSGCNSCLESGCEWDGSCTSSCPADGPCYSPNYFENQSIDEICLEAHTNSLDEYLCTEASLHNCASCTATKKSDGVSTCGWYSDEVTGETWCGTGGGDMFGNIGSSTCNDGSENKKAQASSCNARTSCGSCLTKDSTCVWVEGSCQESCDVIADAACYSLASAPGNTGEEICVVVEEMEADQNKCSADSCKACTGTVKSGGKNCSWYTDGSGNGWCGTGGGDMQGNFVFSDSSKCPAPSQQHGNMRGGAKNKSSFLNSMLP